MDQQIGFGDDTRGTRADQDSEQAVIANDELECFQPVGMKIIRDGPWLHKAKDRVVGQDRRQCCLQL